MPALGTGGRKGGIRGGPLAEEGCASGDKTDPGKPDRAAFLWELKAQPDFNKARSIRPILFLKKKKEENKHFPSQTLLIQVAGSWRIS